MSFYTIQSFEQFSQSVGEHLQLAKSALLHFWREFQDFDELKRLLEQDRLMRKRDRKVLIELNNKILTLIEVQLEEGEDEYSMSVHINLRPAAQENRRPFQDSFSMNYQAYQNLLEKQGQFSAEIRKLRRRCLAEDEADQADDDECQSKSSDSAEDFEEMMAKRKPHLSAIFGDDYEDVQPNDGQEDIEDIQNEIVEQNEQTQSGPNRKICDLDFYCFYCKLLFCNTHKRCSEGHQNHQKIHMNMLKKRELVDFVQICHSNAIYRYRSSLTSLQTVYERLLKLSNQVTKDSALLEQALHVEEFEKLYKIHVKPIPQNTLQNENDEEQMIQDENGEAEEYQQQYQDELQLQNQRSANDDGEFFYQENANLQTLNTLRNKLQEASEPQKVSQENEREVLAWDLPEQYNSDELITVNIHWHKDIPRINKLNQGIIKIQTGKRELQDLKALVAEKRKLTQTQQFRLKTLSMIKREKLERRFIFLYDQMQKISPEGNQQ